MYKFLKSLFCLSLIVLAFAGCRKQALDAYYGRPATLAPPIYQTLQAKGNFTNMLACIDKAGYTAQLSTAGYWTLFAANDDAFKKANINASTLDAATATKIVTYSLINSGYVSTPVGSLPTGGSIEVAQTGSSAILTGAYIPAYKRKTVYHDVTDTTTVPNYPVYGTLAGQNIKVVSQNTPVPTAPLIVTGTSIYYDSKDLNAKYIPYFTPVYFAANGLLASDYNFFYPGATFTNSALNFNVLGGNVVNGNVICENGVVQEINVVPTPLPSLEKTLMTKSDYSHFYSFIQQYGNLVTYAVSPDATHVSQVNTGSNASVYVKQYSNLLAFAPANENLASVSGSTYPQYNGYTLFAPNNAAFDSYVNTVLLEHYPTIASLPQSIIVDFINAHMSVQTIWPSQINKSGFTNAKVENFRINSATDVKDQIVCSNGLFYGTTKAQATNVFATVYGRIYLDPAYSIMARAMAFFTSFRTSLSNPAFKYTMIMIPDVTLRALGYGINASAGNNTTPGSGITYTAPAGSTVTGGDSQLERIINMGIFLTPNNELNNLSGTGIYASAGLNGFAPEVVKYTNYQFYAAGNQDANTTVTVNPSFITCSNGIVYYPASTTGNVTLGPTGPVAPITSTIGNDIFLKGQVAPVNGVGGDPYYMFYKFLSGNTPLWNATTRAITGVDLGTDYTIIIPSNTAMQDAVNNGWLPGTGTGAVKVANFVPTAPQDISLVTNFIKYHILKANQVVPDGKKSGKFITLLFSNDGNSVLLQMNNNLNNLQIIDGQGRVANTGTVSSIVLADRAVILQADNYLQFLDSTGISPNNPNPTKY